MTVKFKVFQLSVDIVGADVDSVLQLQLQFSPEIFFDAVATSSVGCALQFEKSTHEK